MNAVGEMLREALDRSDTPVKELAANSNYSPDAIYAAIKGKRKIPRDAKRNVSRIHPLGGLAVAFEATGYKCFLVMGGDQHHQNVLQKTLKEDAEADRALEGMSWRLIDKQSPEDLTEDDHIALRHASKEVIDRIRADLSLLVTWDDKFKVEVVKMLLQSLKEKEKAAFKAAR